MPFKRHIPSGAGGSTAAVLVLGAGLAAAVIAADRSSDYEWFDPVIVVRRLLLDGFYDKPDEQTMQRAMIEGMVGSLDDPYTAYVPPADEAAFNKALRGTYVGIGAEVNVVDDYLTIVSPLDDSPALDAGVRAGDIVLEIEGKPTYGRSIDECIGELLGEPGTPVTLRVRHLHGTEETIEIIRSRIVTKTVKGVRRVGESWDFWLDEPRGIAYVRLNQFNDASAAELRETLEPLAAGSLEALVLDLRGNPGGELDVAIETADLFLEAGTIVSVRGRNRRAQSWQAKPDGTLPEFPLVILVNRHSASASEIVSGALQENRRAKVLGTRTYGKGSVQEVHELPYDGGTLKMTTAHYYLPSGRTIARTGESPVWGVDPDDGYLVPLTDEQFRDVLVARREFGVIRTGAGTESAAFDDPDWIRATLGDEQLAAAMEALGERLAEGAWPAVGDGGDSTQLAIAQRIRAQIRVREHLLEQLDLIEQNLRELHGLAADAGRAPLVPPDTELAGGRLTLTDREGRLVGAYRLPGAGVERALRDLGARPIEPEP